MAAVIRSDTLLSVLQWLPGLVASVFASYIAAWIAKHDERLNGTLSAWLCIAMGIYGWMTLKVPIPVYEHLLGFVLSPALGLFGGWLRLAQTRARTLPAKAAV